MEEDGNARSISTGGSPSFAFLKLEAWDHNPVYYRSPVLALQIYYTGQQTGLRELASILNTMTVLTVLIFDGDFVEN